MTRLWATLGVVAVGCAAIATTVGLYMYAPATADQPTLVANIASIAIAAACIVAVLVIYDIHGD